MLKGLGSVLSTREEKNKERKEWSIGEWEPHVGHELTAVDIGP